MNRDFSRHLVVEETMRLDRVIALSDDVFGGENACFQLLGDGDIWLYRYHKVKLKAQQMNPFRDLPEDAVEPLGRGLAMVSATPDPDHDMCRLKRPVVRDRKEAGCWIHVGRANGILEYGFGFKGIDWVKLAEYVDVIPEFIEGGEQSAMFTHCSFGVVWNSLVRDWEQHEAE